MPDNELLITLARLEAQLHQPAVRRNVDRVDALLHPDFEEVGRSGRCWTRAAILEMLTSEAAPADVVADSFRVVQLQPGAALLTYRAAHRQPDGTLTHHTLRSSLWVRVDQQWQMRYHQGTAAAQAW